MSRSVSFELFADNQEAQDVVLSSDGKWVAYSLRTIRTRASEYIQSSIYIAETGKESSAKRLTQGTFHDHSPSFSPDDEHLAFLSDRAKAGTASDVYLLPLKGGGEAFQLTSTQFEKAIAGYEFSPDGTKIAFLKPAEDSEERKQQLEDKIDVKVSGEQWDFNQLHIVSLDDRIVTTLDTTGLHISSFVWSPQGDKIAYAAHPGSDLDTVYFGTATLYFVDLSSFSKHCVLASRTAFDGLCWCDEGLRWIQRVDQSTVCSAQAVYGAKPTEQSSYVHLSQGTDDCASNLRKCSGKVVVHIIRGMTDQLQVLGSSSLLREDRCRYRSWDVKFDRNKAIIVLVKGSSGVPLEVFSIIDGQERQLSNHGKALAELKLGTTKIVDYTTEDGFPIDGFYCIPTSLKADFVAKKPLPTVVIAHGGPYGNSNDDFYVDMFPPAWYMSLGYLVLAVNYRGGQGHGNDYSMAVSGNIDRSHQDVVWLVKKGVSDGYIDKDRVAMTGWSQGGFLSYLSATRDNEFHFAAAIPGAGVSDWTTMTMTSDIPTAEADFGGKVPWQADIDWTHDRKSSAIYHMNNIKTPMLLVHGEADPRVPVSQAISFHRGMKARKLYCDMVIYPREDHGLPSGFERAHYLDMMERIASFLKKHMG